MLGFKAAERATKLREVDLSHLKGFHLRFAPKNEWHDLSCNWCPRLHLNAERIGSTPIDQNVCVSLTSIKGANLFTLY